MDAAFHKLLRPLGGHHEICKELGSAGLGLVDAQAHFRSAIRDGDVLDVSVSIAEWSRRSVTLAYEGRVGTRLAFEAREVRCLFIRANGGIVAGDINALRDKLEKTK